MSLFSHIDTVIVRVRDISRAVQWYSRTLGLAAVYSDPAEGLTGVRFFTFRDLDGNRLEACQVLT
jgi:catechol-2,3-dioxygenase